MSRGLTILSEAAQMCNETVKARGIRMSKQFQHRPAFCAVTAAFLALVLNSATVAAPQAQPAGPQAIDFADHQGYISIFDGKTLTGWEGQPGLWRVEDGSIVGETAKDMFVSWAFPNTFLLYRGITAKDFDLKLEIKVENGGGSGIQYRSSVGTQAGQAPGKANEGRDPRYSMIGPQADFWYPVSEQAKDYSGQLYSQNTGLGTIVLRGQVVHSLAGRAPQLVGLIGDRGKLGALVNDGAWNQYTIIARGGVILHILNGQLMAVLVDDDPASSNNVSGLFGLQVEGVPCKVSFRNLWLRKIN
jgi:hypothetical protein